ncbi:hypothetical protein Daus18300_000205 [Diaporthe australafricana]|uniref:Tetraspanin Tsp3 n=1 Tax=Diaporthe australafricana TaxID=127596 RepID=A0ABR3Y736_9PEZI
MAAAANAFALPYVIRARSRSSKQLWAKLAHPAITQGLQGILAVIMATLYTTYIAPGVPRDCGLAKKWQRLFQVKDAQSVKAIQDAFECCGFRSVKDMAWPFLPTEVTCAQRFDRQLPCEVPWTSAMQTSAGVELGIVVVVAVLQIASLVFPQQFAGRFQESSWRRFFGGRRPHSSDYGPSSSRPLITNGDTPAEEVDEEVGSESQTNGYRYGTLDERNGDGPRIEPSGLRQDGSEWRDE